MAVTYLQSPAEDDGASGVRLFLAGGAKEDWRRPFAQLLSDRAWIVYDPINFEWHQHALDRRIDWEVRHFERADVAVAWLPEAPSGDFSAQSPTTCFELGQLAVIKPRLHVGIAPGHPGRDTLVERLRRHAPHASIDDTLEGLAQTVCAAQADHRPSQIDRAQSAQVGHGDFHVGGEIGFGELFDLGLAIRRGRPRVTIDAQNPMARELTAQLARLFQSK